MPVLTDAEKSELRRHPHVLGCSYLYVVRPETVLACQVNGNEGYDQVVAFHNVSEGSIADVRRGMPLEVAGKGTVRVRQNGMLGDTDLYLAEHEINLVDGDSLVVRDTYPLWHVDPYITNAGVIYKDWNGMAGAPAIAFPPAMGGLGFENAYLPVPCPGPHSVQFLQDGVAEHVYDFSRSWPINPLAGDAIAAWAATFPDGDPAASGSPTGTVVWTTAGARWVELTVTDSRGVTSYSGKRLYVTLDGTEDNLYVDFQPGPRQGSVDQGGFTMSFTVRVDASREDFPAGSLVLWFVEGGSQQGIGGNWPGRSHIKFVGYIREASTHKEPETGYVTFTADTIQARMKTLPVFPNFLEDVDPGDCNLWTEAVNLSVQSAFTLHARWHSNLFEVADVIFEPSATTRIREHEFSKGDLYGQLSSLVDRDYRYRIGCDYHSTVYINKEPAYRDLAARTTVDTIMDIQAQDWHTSLDFPEAMEPRTAYILASGIAAPGAVTVAYFSESPGPVGLDHGDREDLSRLICTTQDALNVLSGLVLANRNNPFPDIPVQLEGQYYGLDHLFPMEFVGLDVRAVDTRRGYDFSSDLFVPRRSTLEVQYDPDQALSHGMVSLNLAKLTYGPPGQTLVYPAVGSLVPEGPPDVPASPTYPGDAGTPSSEEWEEEYGSGGAWVDDGGDGGAEAFFILDLVLYAFIECGDACRGLYERTGPATWALCSPNGCDVVLWGSRFWLVGDDNTVYSSTDPSVGWNAEYTPSYPAGFHWTRTINAYGAYIYVTVLEDTTAFWGSPDRCHFVRYSTAGGWEEDFIPAYTHPMGFPEQLTGYDFVYWDGYYWWSLRETGIVPDYVLKRYQAAWANAPTNLQAGKIRENTYWHAMHFRAPQLDVIYLHDGGVDWDADYAVNLDLNLAQVSIEALSGHDNAWAGYEIDGANIGVCTHWAGEADWRTILPACVDTVAYGAIRGPDNLAYLGGSNNIWRYVP